MTMARKPVPPPSRGMARRQPDDLGVPRRPEDDGWHEALCPVPALIFAIVFGLVGVLAGIALGDAPRTPPPPDTDICTKARC